MIYGEAKSAMTMAVRNVAKAYKLPLFLMAAIMGDIAAEYEKEAGNELAIEMEQYASELEVYYQEKLSSQDPEPEKE
jgi:hypothetical protein